jgi:deoxyribodipyrimidine photolyase-like uncharacterized protein
MSIIRAYNEHHLGDNLYNCILFYNIKDYLEKNNVTIEYYCHKQYIEQVSEFITTPKVVLKTMDELNDKKSAFVMWISGDDYGYGNKPLDMVLTTMFNKFLKKNDIPIQINKLEYTDPDLLDRRKKLENDYGDKYKNIDILILNSKPMSGQYNYDETKWNSFIKNLNKQKKIVCTTSIP